MKRLLATTAIFTMIAGPTFAETAKVTGDPAQIFVAQPNGTDLYGSDFIGMRIHAMQDGAREDIGEISDVLISRSGDVKAVLIDVGGFVGIGEKTVAIDMDDLSFDRAEGEDMVLVVESNREALMNAPEFTHEAPETWRHSDMFNVDWPKKPNASRDGYEEVTLDRLTAEDLEGARVYDTADDNVGEVSDLLVNAKGEIEAAVIDVGGFLGWGEHTVAVPLEKVQILRAADGSAPRLQVEISREQLEKMKAFNG